MPPRLRLVPAALLGALLVAQPLCAWAQGAQPSGGGAPTVGAEAQAASGQAPDAALADAPVQGPAAAVANPDAGAADAAPARPRGHAHHPKSPAQVLDDQVKALTKELDLDPKQQVRVREILIQQRVGLLQLRKDGGQDKVAASHAVFQRAKDELRAILTPEQRQKYFVDAPEDKLAPAQADRDYWLNVSRSKPRNPQAGGAQPGAGPSAPAVGSDPAK